MNENPTCRAPVRADLKAFADGELSPFVRLRVARHLRVCPSCRQELIEMQTLSTELQEVEGETAPLAPELRAHILESVPVEEANDEAVQLRHHRIYRKKAILAVCACSLAGLILVTALQSSGVMGGSSYSSPSTADIAMPPNDGAASSTGAFPNGASAAAPPPPLAPSMETSKATDEIFKNGQLKARPDSELRATFAPGAAANQVAPSAASSAGAASASNPIYTNPDNFSVVPPTRAVHRQGSMSVDVPNAEDASDDATLIIKNAGGFIAQGGLETGANQRRIATLDCRVPVAQFEVVVRKIGALGKVRAKTLSGQDITTQVVQSGARRQTLAQELAIAQAKLDRSEKAEKKTGDTFQLRAEVRTLRIQASQARAQLEALQKYGALSSLYVSLQDAAPTPTAKATGWTDSLSPTSRAAWETFLSNARLPLQVVMWMLAYSPLWLPLLLVWRKFGRKWLME